ncbi:hypothetical protein BKA58DRAFT_48241 [Alternaria rosae]|uniref:uncharacterized protein n=1 Tax=Alternaria rosae TaxID=1187941 RepID=UPI001E8D3418|nr:uncharacterized protein BKA58DRAFT_48241 [Alternaria rosae]KAH6861178.1 hypothetical protein BKA58DRAFT_48241 [Alternaria rosae]
MPDYTPEGYEWLGELISAMNSSQAHASDHDLLERAILGEDVLLTPCILSACNLERLWLRLPKSQLDEDSPSFLLNSIVHSANEGGFERLKVLHLDVYQSGVGWPVRNALPLFLLPSLTDLTIGNCGETDLGRPWSFGPDTNDSAFMGEPWMWPDRTSSITKLSLLSPHFSGSIVAKMLLACKVLTEFEVVSPYQRPPCDDEFYEDVGVALLAHVETLVRLSLGDQMALVGRTLFQNPGTFRMGSLLSSLTFLRANPYILLGYSHPRAWSIETSPMLKDALPDSLEHLWLDEPCKPWTLHTWPYFEGLFRAIRSGQLPQLKSIHIHWYQAFPHNWDTIIHRVRHLIHLREAALWRAGPIVFTVTVRIAYSTSEYADQGFGDFVKYNNIRYSPPKPSPLVYCRRSDLNHPDGRRYYVEAGTCEVPHKTPEEMQDDMDHGYWRILPPPDFW